MVAFDITYCRDARPSPSQQDVTLLANYERVARGITDFLATHAGGSFSEGLYRIHNVATMPRWTRIVAEAFPDFRKKILCFGVDWLGRMFALDLARIEDGQCLVLMLEPGTGQALEVPVTFMEFHDQELVRHKNAALAAQFFDAWRSSGGESPEYEQCVGYKQPLFMYGSDIVENLEMTSLEVYWSISAQLLSKIRNLPDGTRIKGVRFKD
jgi:hypothetical protein